jgi:hypothetical protein
MAATGTTNDRARRARGTTWRSGTASTSAWAPRWPRLEGKIATGTLLARFPRLVGIVAQPGELIGGPEQVSYHPSFLFNGLTTLPVTLG